jgi:hypothetical protein
VARALILEGGPRKRAEKIALSFRIDAALQVFRLDQVGSEIIKVANLESPSPELIAELEAAKRETRFSAVS